MERQIYPKQRVSFKQKIASNYKWWKDSMDAQLYSYMDYGTFPTYGSLTHLGDSEYDRMLSNYQLYNNLLNQKDFERECNPMGLSVGQFQDEIKPYNKSYNKINVILGEHLKRPFDYTTAVINEEAVSQKMEEKDQAMRSFLRQGMESVKELIAQDVQNWYAENPAQSQEEQQALQQKISQFIDQFVSPEKISAYVGEGTIQNLEKAYSKILKYFQYTHRLKDKMNDSFKHGLISGYEYAWVGIKQGEPVVEIKNPLGMMYVKSPETKFIQDGNAAGFRTSMTTSDVLTQYGDLMLEKDIKKVEDYYHGYSGNRYNSVGEYMVYPNDDIALRHAKNQAGRSTWEGSYGRSESISDDWKVHHLEWVSERKIYFETRINEYGDQEVNMLSEDFEIPSYARRETITLAGNKKKTLYHFDGSTLETAWIPEVLTGTRIGDDIYVGMEPKELQFRSIDNPYKVKLGYHGIAYSNMNAPNVSLMDRMKPFQYLYFLAMHKLKELIAKDKGKLFHFDITMVDPKIGVEKTLYYLNHLDIDIYNPLMNAETAGAAQRGKVTATTDRNNMQQISNYIMLLDQLDNQISDVAGVTKQREGQSSPHEAVSNHQQNIVQSTHITEPYFHLNGLHWQECLNSLCKTAAHLWKDTGVKRQYVLDDQSIEVLNIAADELEGMDVNVFITNLPRENQVFQKIQSLAEPLIRSEKAKISDIIKLFNADSLSEATRTIKKTEAEAEAKEKAMMEQQERMQQQQIEAQQAEEEAKREHEKEITEMEIRGKLAVEELKLKGQAAISSTDVADTPVEQGATEDNSSEMEFREKELRSKERLEREKLAIERKKAAQSKQS